MTPSLPQRCCEYFARGSSPRRYVGTQAPELRLALIHLGDERSAVEHVPIERQPHLPEQLTIVVSVRPGPGFEVIWKLPGKGDRALGLEPILPENLTAVAPPTVRRVPAAWVQRATYKSDGTPLVGRSISIDGLSGVQTDVLLRIELLDGSTHSAILRPNSPTFEIPARESKKEVALATLGVVNFRAAPTEAVIALSIVFLAAEVIRMRNGE